MNKTLLITGMALAALMTGCTTDTTSQDSDGDSFSPTEITESKDAIQLGSGQDAFAEGTVSSAKQFMTRSTINSDAKGNFTLNGIHLFCLATRQLHNGLKYPIDWSIRGITSAGVQSYSVWLDDVIVNAKDTLINEKDTTILQWADGHSRYYPIGNGHAYSFYAIYPKPQDISYASNYIYGRVDMYNGATDVIWGSADKQSSNPTGVDTLAYCSKYFHQNGKYGECPTMTFKHALMRLHFTFVSGPDAIGNTDSAKQLRIGAVEIYKVPTTGYLYIASNDGVHKAGSVVCDWTDKTKMQTIELEDSDGVGALKKEYWVTDEQQDLGQSIMVPVPPSPLNDYYEMSITLYKKGYLNEDGTPKAIKSIIKWPLSLKKDYTYETGKSYNVNLKVYGLQWIANSATLVPWVDVNTAFDDNSTEIN
ncbi:MAG: fimbrillin family protein [Prevotella sp.]|nr:fimbrillin family protein [Prevotella sp.]